MKLHGEEVKVGDKVWHVINGWGEVTELDEGSTDYPILVQWGGRGWFEWFTKDGKTYPELDETPTLFWQPIKFEIPRKPKREKAWQWICRDDTGKCWLTYMHHTNGEEVLEYFPNAEHVEPYLPSEIEREMKGTENG